MRRCYRGAALALGGILMTGLTSHDSCSFGTLTVYAAEDTLTEELETAFQEEVRTGEENVTTDIQEEEPEMVDEVPEETAMEDAGLEAEEPAVEETGSKSAGEEPATEDVDLESVMEDTGSTEEPVMEESAQEEAASEECFAEGSSDPQGLAEQEYQVLLKIVEAEAGGEDSTGRLLIANVIMNRVRSGRFPNTITEVVYQRCSGRAQFSPVSDGRIDQVSVSPETVEAVARAMNGEDLSAGALYFRSVYSKSGWFDRALHRVLEHGNHIFYTM